MHSHENVSKDKEDPPTNQPVPGRRKRSRFSSFAKSTPSPTTAATTAPTPAPAEQAPAVVASVKNLRARIDERIRNAIAHAEKLVDNHKAASLATHNVDAERLPAAKRARRSRFAAADAPPSKQPVSSVSKTLSVVAAPPVASTKAVPEPQNMTTQVRTEVQQLAVAKALPVTAIPIVPRQTLRINQKKESKKKLKAILAVNETDLLEKDPAKNAYFDTQLRNRTSAQRQKRKGINFIPQGKIIEQAKVQRAQDEVQTKREQYIQSLTCSSAQTAERPVLPPLAEDLTLKPPPKTPAVEWWDIPFINPQTESDTIQLRQERITHYIHHPVKIQPSKPPPQPRNIPLMLTKKETKKLRRQRRMELQKEQQEMIAAGILPQPEPKVKLSNMVRILATEASSDPTKVEERVRAQVGARRLKHEADNQARKKSGEERREKARDKRKKDRDAGLEAAVFRVADLSDAGHRFKVDRNARQLDMTGVMAIFNNCNVVVVEGGSKAIRKYKSVMLRRIKWCEAAKRKGDGVEEEREEDDDSRDQDASQGSGGCVLVWEGGITSPSFESFNVMRMTSEANGRAVFGKRGVEHYWDLCMQASPLGNDKIGLRQV